MARALDATDDHESPTAKAGLALPISAGVVTALIGFTSSFAIVLAGLTAVGADPVQAASGLRILCVTQALGILLLSFRYRIPTTLAWSTPGAALLASTGTVAGGWSAAVGAFLLVGVFIVCTGLSRRLGDLVAAIPMEVAQAMLAGVLLPICLAPVQAVRTSPGLVVPVILVWLVLQRFTPRWSVLAAFGTAVLGAAISIIVHQRSLDVSEIIPTVAVSAPEWSWQAIVGIAVPLYVVTMASQNIPGVAVMKSYGYTVPWRASMTITGLGTIIGAPMGGHAINLAAISAALAAAPTAHPDPERRWVAAFASGVTYLFLALGSGVLIALVAISPKGVFETVAGLALLAALGGALSGALASGEHREASIVTIVIAASGLSFGGIGAALWALLAGLVVRAVLNRSSPRSWAKMSCALNPCRVARPSSTGSATSAATKLDTAAPVRQQPGHDEDDSAVTGSPLGR